MLASLFVRAPMARVSVSECAAMSEEAQDDARAFAEAAARVAAGAEAKAEASALVQRMTRDEALDMLDGDTDFWPAVEDLFSGGINAHAFPAAACERLGIPGFWFADGPRGCVVGPSTVFPVSMARGASFDPELEERVGEAIGAELRASGATYTGAVCMNLVRHPAWGRSQETYGEDPHHVGEMAAALTRGLQRHVLACMKHFALNSMENARFSVDVVADERALHEVYLPHFRRVVEEDVASVMSAYNSVNGHYCGENRVLLQGVLRDEWGFDGFVTSDWLLGLRDGPKSVRAGLDVEMPARQVRAMTLRPALEDGTLDLADVELRATAVVATLLRFSALTSQRFEPEVLACDVHRRLAHEACVAGTVLLRNATLRDGRRLLPRAPGEVRRVVVLGELAARPNLGDAGSSSIRQPEVVLPLDGVRAAYPDAEVVLGDRAEDARSADLVVVVVGNTRREEGEFVGGQLTAFDELLPPAPDGADLSAFAQPEGGAPVGGRTRGGDRASLRLLPEHERLVEEAAACSDRVVVCVMGGGTFVMPWLDEVGAALHLFYPGMQGGAALGDMLTGVAEPGGRLPLVMPRGEADLGSFDPEATSVVYDLFHGQWLLDRSDTPPHRPFGFGLGYTSFQVAEAEIEDGGDAVRIVARNVGHRAGSTVVQVYASLPDSAWERPVRRLVGFAKVRGEAGAAAEVRIAIHWDALRVRSEGRFLTEAGTYRLEIGQAAGSAERTLDVSRPAG